MKLSQIDKNKLSKKTIFDFGIEFLIDIDLELPSFFVKENNEFVSVFKGSDYSELGYVFEGLGKVEILQFVFGQSFCRNYSLIDKLRLFKLLDKSIEYKDLIRLFNFPKSISLKNDINKILALDHYFINFITEKKLGFKLASKFLNYDKSVLGLLLSLEPKISLTASNIFELLNLLEELQISNVDNILSQIDSNDINLNTRNILNYLYRLRNLFKPSIMIKSFILQLN